MIIVIPICKMGKLRHGEQSDLLAVTHLVRGSLRSEPGQSGTTVNIVLPCCEAWQGHEATGNGLCLGKSGQASEERGCSGAGITWKAKGAEEKVGMFWARSIVQS